MSTDSRFTFTETATRPKVCPSCGGRVIDTFAKVVTVTTWWRCRECDRTWTIAGLSASAR